MLNKSTGTCYYYVPASSPPPVPVRTCFGSTFPAEDNTSCVPCGQGVAKCVSLTNATACNYPETTFVSGKSQSPNHQHFLLRRLPNALGPAGGNCTSCSVAFPGSYTCISSAPTICVGSLVVAGNACVEPIVAPTPDATVYVNATVTSTATPPPMTLASGEFQLCYSCLNSAELRTFAGATATITAPVTTVSAPTQNITFLFVSHLKLVRFLTAGTDKNLT